MDSKWIWLQKNRIQNLCINAAENSFNDVSTNLTSHSSDEDDENFILFSSQPESTKKVDLEVITFFNDKIKSLSMLNNYPLIKKIIYLV